MNDVIILFLCHIFFGGMKTMKCSVWSRNIIWTSFRLISWHSKLEWTFTQASIWTLAIVWTYALIYPSASVWTNFIVWTYQLLCEHIVQYEHVWFIVNTTFKHKVWINLNMLSLRNVRYQRTFVSMITFFLEGTQNDDITVEDASLR